MADIRELMRQKKAAQAQKKAPPKLAKWLANGELQCLVCEKKHANVRSEALWAQHIRSAPHVVALQEWQRKAAAKKLGMTQSNSGGAAPNGGSAPAGASASPQSAGASGGAGGGANERDAGGGGDAAQANGGAGNGTKNNDVKPPVASSGGIRITGSATRGQPAKKSAGNTNSAAAGYSDSDDDGASEEKPAAPAAPAIKMRIKVSDVSGAETAGTAAAGKTEDGEQEEEADNMPSENSKVILSEKAEAIRQRAQANVARQLRRAKRAAGGGGDDDDEADDEEARGENGLDSDLAVPIPKRRKIVGPAPVDLFDEDDVTLEEIEAHQRVQQLAEPQNSNVPAGFFDDEDMEAEAKGVIAPSKIKELEREREMKRKEIQRDIEARRKQDMESLEAATRLQQKGDEE
eukprot:gene359-188_t